MEKSWFINSVGSVSNFIFLTCLLSGCYQKVTFSVCVSCGGGSLDDDGSVRVCLSVCLSVLLNSFSKLPPSPPHPSPCDQSLPRWDGHQCQLASQAPWRVRLASIICSVVFGHFYQLTHTVGQSKIDKGSVKKIIRIFPRLRVEKTKTFAIMTQTHLTPITPLTHQTPLTLTSTTQQTLYINW